MTYLLIKSLHIVAVISWMAAMLYLPRLFVYHAEAQAGSEASETFKVMEKRLLRFIATPAMLVTWAAGLYLMISGGWMANGWMHAKLTLVLVLSGYHGWCAATVKRFQVDRNQRPARSFRMLNEIPALLMVFIVVLVVLKPF